MELTELINQVETEKELRISGHLKFRGGLDPYDRHAHSGFHQDICLVNGDSKSYDRHEGGWILIFYNAPIGKRYLSNEIARTNHKYFERHNEYNSAYLISKKDLGSVLQLETIKLQYKSEEIDLTNKEVIYI